MQEDAFQIYKRSRDDLIKSYMAFDDVSEELTEFVNSLTNLHHHNLEINKSWIDDIAYDIMKASDKLQAVEEGGRIIGYKDRDGRIYYTDPNLGVGVTRPKPPVLEDRKEFRRPKISDKDEKRFKRVLLGEPAKHMHHGEIPMNVKMAHEMTGWPEVSEKNATLPNFFKRGIHPDRNVHPIYGGAMYLHKNTNYVAKDFTDSESKSESEKDGEAIDRHEKTHSSNPIISGYKNKQHFLGKLGSDNRHFHHFYEKNYQKWKDSKYQENSQAFSDLDENQIRELHAKDAMAEWTSTSHYEEPVSNLEYQMRKTGKSEKEIIDDIIADIKNRSLRYDEEDDLIRNAKKELKKSTVIKHPYKLGWLDNALGLAWLSPIDRSKVKQHLIDNQYNDKNKQFITLSDGSKLPVGYLKRQFRMRTKHEYNQAMRNINQKPPSVQSDIERADVEGGEYGTTQESLDELDLYEHVENEVNEYIHGNKLKPLPLFNIDAKNKRLINNLTKYFKKEKSANPLYDAYKHVLEGGDFKNGELQDVNEKIKDKRNFNQMKFNDFLDLIHMESDGVGGYKNKNGKHKMFGKNIEILSNNDMKELKKLFDNKLGLSRQQKDIRRAFTPFDRISSVGKGLLSKDEMSGFREGEFGEHVPVGNFFGKGFEIGGYPISPDHFMEFLHNHTIHKEEDGKLTSLFGTSMPYENVLDPVTNEYKRLEGMKFVPHEHGIGLSGFMNHSNLGAGETSGGLIDAYSHHDSSTAKDETAKRVARNYKNHTDHQSSLQKDMHDMQSPKMKGTIDDYTKMGQENSKDIHREAIQRGYTFRPNINEMGEVILEQPLLRHKDIEGLNADHDDYIRPVRLKESDKPVQYEYTRIEDGNPVKQLGSYGDIQSYAQKQEIELARIEQMLLENPEDPKLLQSKKDLESTIESLVPELRTAYNEEIKRTSGSLASFDLDRYKHKENQMLADNDAITQYAKQYIMPQIQEAVEKGEIANPFDTSNPEQFYINTAYLRKLAINALGVDETNHGITSLGYSPQDVSATVTTDLGSKRGAVGIPEHETIHNLMHEDNFGVMVTEQDSPEQILNKLNLPNNKETEAMVKNVQQEIFRTGPLKLSTIGQMITTGFHPAGQEIDDRWISNLGEDEHGHDVYDEMWNNLEIPQGVNSNQRKKLKSSFVQNSDIFGGVEEIRRRMGRASEEGNKKYGLTMFDMGVKRPQRGWKKHSDSDWKKYQKNTLHSIISLDPSKEVTPDEDIEFEKKTGLVPGNVPITHLGNPNGRNIHASEHSALAHYAGFRGTPSFGAIPQPDGTMILGSNNVESNFLPPNGFTDIHGEDTVNQLKQQISQNGGINLEGGSDVIGSSVQSGEYMIKAKLPTEMPLIEPLHKIFEIEDLEQLRGFTGEWVASHHVEGKRLKIARSGNHIKSTTIDNETYGLSNEILSSLRKLTKKNYTIDATRTDDGLYINDVMHYDNTDVTDLNTRERVKLLRGQFDSHENVHVPSPSTLKVTDEEGLENAVKDLLEHNENGKILLRDAKSSYMKGEEKHPKWVLMTKSDDIYHVPFGMEIDDEHFILHFVDDIVKYDILEDDVSNPRSMLAELSNSQYPITLAKSLETYWRPAFYEMWKAEKEKRMLPEQKPDDEKIEEESAGIIDVDDESRIMKPKRKQMLKTLELIARALDVLEKGHSNMAGRGLGIDVGAQIESPRGPTRLTSEESMPDWDMKERPTEDMEKPEKYPGRHKKMKISQENHEEIEEDLDTY